MDEFNYLLLFSAISYIVLLVAVGLGKMPMQQPTEFEKVFIEAEKYRNEVGIK